MSQDSAVHGPAVARQSVAASREALFEGFADLLAEQHETRRRLIVAQVGGQAELDAARAANRDLTCALNQRG
ncbi:hypothetical protein [Streptomyces sp. HUAS TT7]|uniref:hypothetical protein n=1 Tax=Streptomyces sp. HUAS TT7 TaxID=3447507 RepID=UPI003F65C17D